MVTRWSEKSPGLKILWIWTIGTAAVLVTNVFTARIREMDKILNEEDALRSKTDPAAASSQEHIIADE
ncbi:hypothetical protein ZIOFF_066564 [Zingiber officinale]|uniref:Uncharacterized protein n=1 Tax=Zingiber officinale TaxID=94328 RepID=A0A8J5EYF0_ZINOF|nr:hypothetical protein ZIOFF_066564 [Zingiber officinale]